MEPKKDSVRMENGLSEVCKKNIHLLMSERQKKERRKGIHERVADRVTAWAGSLGFLYFHLVWFGGWILWNLFRPTPFDPYPFGLLTMIVSLEAIFLSGLVLLSQNRMTLIADRRADLDLHINLLAEHEVTKLIILTSAIAKHLNVKIADGEINELAKEIAPVSILREIDKAEKQAQKVA
jgi:uncharacterized membrane protein